MTRLIAFLPLLCAISVSAQSVEKLRVEVSRDDQVLRYPFAGGLEAPQISQVDLDRDTKPDLLVFDRSGYVQIPFLYRDEGGQGRYIIDWEVIADFPDLPLWTLFRDFNGDGVEDIFASTSEPGIQGIDVFRGSEKDGKLTFRKMGFDQGQLDLIYIEISNGFTPLYSAWNDIPVISDIDGDSDLDILTFDPGGAFLSYFRNTSLEQGLGLDTLVFEWEDVCWGKFRENDFTEEILLSDSPDKCADAFLQVIATRHSGSASAVADIESDGDQDLLLGDLGSAGITLLINGGDNENAWMTDQVPMFPMPGIPVDIPYFVAPFVADVNLDGKPDLLAASNNDNFSENVDVLWYYENTGTATNAEFTFVQSDLFVDHMLDFGSDSRPAFGDVTGDGLPDIIVGTGGYYVDGERDPRLVLLRNTGSASAPSFEIADEDFLGFSTFGMLQMWGFSPTVGDLDGDGDVDLVIGENDGGLFYCENIAGPGESPVFRDPQYPYAGVDVGSASTPHIFDVNGDGLMDLIVGERLGNNDNLGKCSNLNYFQNIGGPGTPAFEPDPSVSPNSQCFGRVLFNPQIALAEYSAPLLFFRDGQIKVLVGSDEGKLRLYGAVEGNIYGEFQLEEKDYGQIRDGFRTAPAIADLNSDGKYELVLGNRRGGLTLYSTTLNVDRTYIPPDDLAGEPFIFPNPAGNIVHLRLPFDCQGCRITIFDVDGKIVFNGPSSGNDIDVSELPAGIYLAQIVSGHGSISGKLVIQR